MQLLEQCAHQLCGGKLRVGADAEINVLIHDQLAFPNTPPRTSTAMT
jgi:hypothetical protein